MIDLLVAVAILAGVVWRLRVLSLRYRPDPITKLAFAWRVAASWSLAVLLVSVLRSLGLPTAGAAEVLRTAAAVGCLFAPAAPLLALDAWWGDRRPHGKLRGSLGTAIGVAIVVAMLFAIIAIYDATGLRVPVGED